MAALAVAACAGAQSNHPLKKDGSVRILLNNSADSAKVYQTMLDNSPASAKVPGAPRFAIVGRNEEFYLGIGGKLTTTVSYDFGNPITNPDAFITSAIPMDLAKGNGSRFGISARQSGMFVNFIAMPHSENRIGVFIGANLMGENYAPNLKYAYMKYRGFSAGYDNTLFADMAAGVPTVDYEGPNSMPSISSTVLNYTHNFNESWTAGIGIEKPLANYTISSLTEVVSQRVPDIPVFARYSWTPGSWVRLSGVFRNMAYRDLREDKNRNVFGWGLNLSGSAEFGVPGLRAYWQGIVGKGIASYFQDITGLGIDMYPNPSNTSNLLAVKCAGGYVGASYQIMPKLSATVAYSHLRVVSDRYWGGNPMWVDQYKTGQYFVANAFYTLSDIMTAAVELDWGRRLNNSGVSRQDFRIQAMAQISF